MHRVGAADHFQRSDDGTDGFGTVFRTVDVNDFNNGYRSGVISFNH
jgi:hypothetical protein